MEAMIGEDLIALDQGTSNGSHGGPDYIGDNINCRKPEKIAFANNSLKQLLSFCQRT